jgi:hypothetical protein
MPLLKAADDMHVVRLVPGLLALVLVLTGCGTSAVRGSDEQEKLARDYVAAINERDGDRVCELMTRAAAAELSVPDSNLPCERTVAGLIGYVEDAGVPEFLSYRLDDVRSGTTQGEYSSIRLSIEARRRSTNAEQAFETCSFEDTVWLTRQGGEFRIANISPALYVAFGATSIPDEVLAPDVDAATGEAGKHPLDCEPERGDQGNPEAPLQTPAGLAAHLAQESDQVSDVRCIEADGSDGWDMICTYFDARLGERMKSGYRFGPNSALMSGGAVPEAMPLPAAPAS